jgi:hypothetical protein
LIYNARGTSQILSLRNNNLAALGPAFADVFPGLRELSLDANDLDMLDLTDLRGLRAVSVSHNRWVSISHPCPLF